MNLGTGPRVLVVGGHIEDNQFVRNARALGCQVIWHNGNPGKSFPHFCEALICAKYQLSHEGFWSAKAAYKDKPTFIADHSWSTIKERFEFWVDEWELKNKGKLTAMGVAMQQADKDKPEVTKIPEPATAPKRRRMTMEEIKNKYPAICDAVIAHYKAGMWPEEAARQMNLLKFTVDGRQFDAAFISLWRHKLGLPGKRKRKAMREGEQLPLQSPGAAGPQTTQTTQTTVPTAQAWPAVKSKGPDKLVYELILSANLPAIETTALMRKCMEGKLTQEECLKFIEFYTDLRGS
jgi:hypothetical protein